MKVKFDSEEECVEFLNCISGVEEDDARKNFNRFLDEHFAYAECIIAVSRSENFEEIIVGNSDYRGLRQVMEEFKVNVEILTKEFTEVARKLRNK